MNETDKRIISWGMEGKCLIVHAGGTIVDVGKYTHLAYPPRRGIYIYPSEMLGYADSLKAFSKTNTVSRRFCERCPYEKNCDPLGASVINDKLWHPAMRPEKQRR